MSDSVNAEQELQNAFEQFNQQSKQLAGSWSELRHEVLDLHGELAAARDECRHLRNENRLLSQQTAHTRNLSSMGEMTARLAHQIRTPLSTALLYASQLKQLQLNHRQRDCFVDRLLVGLHHLDHMVNDMLLFARGAHTRKQAVPVKQLLQQVRDAVLPGLQQAGAEWVEPPVDDRLVVRGQQDLLISALGNLVSNSLEAASSPVRLEWQVARQGSEIVLALQDDGPGIGENLHEQIFEPFFTTRSTGTGLGLAVVNAVVSAHDGRIEVDHGYTTGARFVIRLPAHEVHGQMDGLRAVPASVAEAS